MIDRMYLKLPDPERDHFQGTIDAPIALLDTEITNVLFAAKFSQLSEKFSADLGAISVLPSGIFRSRMFIRMLSMQLKPPKPAASRELSGQCTKRCLPTKTRSTTNRWRNTQLPSGWTKHVFFRK